ncbi:MAG: hypothetical protein Q7V88_11605 [Actinomycetota bacterium]|nr:hypothetical protein [Actinomycetota bacterium]
MSQLDVIARLAAAELNAETDLRADSINALAQLHATADRLAPVVATRQRRRWAMAVGVAAAALVLVGVAMVVHDDDEIMTMVPASTTAPATTQDAGTAPVTSAAVTTTATPTTATPTTTASPTMDGVALLVGGVEGLEFGAGAEVSVAYFEALAGAPSSDATVEYPVNVGDEYWEDENEALGFAFRIERRVCWYSDSFCIELGGGDPGALQFVGWRSTAGPFATSEGISVGTTWAEIQDLVTIPPRSYCASWAYAATESGVRVTLYSQDIPFVETDPVTIVETFHDPDPSRVVVQDLSAGEVRFDVHGDC